MKSNEKQWKDEKQWRVMEINEKYEKPWKSMKSDET